MMKKMLTTAILGLAIMGSTYAGSRNRTHSVTIDSTGIYEVDLNRGPVQINIIPDSKAHYTFTCYTKSISISLLNCQNSMVSSIFKTSGSRISLTAKLCRDKKYKLQLARTSTRIDSMILKISKEYPRVSRRVTVLSNCRKVTPIIHRSCEPIITTPKRSSCNSRTYRQPVYYKSKSHHKESSSCRTKKRSKSSHRSSRGISLFGITFKF